MELNWTTFILEIINFLVLMWLLQHFLYKPVLAVIARRRAAIEQSLEDAKKMRAEADALQQRYEGRLGDWEQQRQQARAKLQQEIEEERKRLQQELQQEIEEKQKKAETAAERQRQERALKAEQTAFAHGARFATRLLEAAAGPEVEEKLLELLVSELQKLPEERLAALRGGQAGTPAEIRVSSAFALADDQRGRLRKALAAAMQADVTLHFEQDPELLAGLRITIGAWVLGANLKDELQGFAEMARTSY